MSRHTILCIDDESSILSSLKRDLRGLDHDLFSVTTAEEALDILKEKTVSLVISDQRMPSMTGIDLFQKVRDVSPDTVRILLTAYLDVETAMAAINKGEVYRYILKPWDKEDLLLTVKHGLEKYSFIREIKEQREKLIEINRELSKEKAMVSAMINAMGEGLIVADREGKITFVNRAIEKLLIKSEEDIVGKRIDDFFKSNSESRGRHPKEGRYYINMGMKEIPVMMISSPLINEKGIQSGSVNTVRDISAEYELEQRKADFFAMIIHDLRSPLISNIYGIKILQNRLKENINEEFSKILDENTATLQRGLDLVNNLLDISKFDSGKVEIKREGVDISEVVDISIRSLGPLSEIAGISVDKEYKPDIPLIKGDRELLTRLMINLIGNAIKFSQQGSNVRISAASTGFGVKISIIDKGPGIPEEKLSSIFDRYVQSGRHPKEEKLGTGLGLAICKQIVEAHSGRILAGNVEGGGSIFTVDLPVPGNE